MGIRKNFFWILLPLVVISTSTTEWKSVDDYAVIRWSVEGESLCQETGSCCPDSACSIPENELWIIDADMDVGTLEINGFLQWDEYVENVTLSTNFILVNSHGQFKMVTENKAEIFIKKPNDVWHPIHGDQTGLGYHAEFGSRFFVGDARSNIEIIGKQLVNTWTLLTQNANSGDTKLHLKDDISDWNIGDEIGIATTKRSDSTRHHIKSINGQVITIDSALKSDHWGGFRDLPEGYRLEMAAEVVNLERNIVIRGPDEDTFNNENHSQFRSGFHFGTFNAEESNDSIFNVRYTRVQNCGQNNVIGRYCFHFHLKRKCPSCTAVGNAVVNSVQGAIVVHGTHQSEVSKNILWDSVSVGLYTEDGNEMNNTFIENVMICSDIYKCNFQKNPWQVESGVKEGGLFWFGMTNNAIGNRVIGHEHGMWTVNTGNGKGAASGKICTQHAPFLKIESNVFHDCQRFGMYPDNQQPRDLIRDDNGYSDENSCKYFKQDGSDNGYTSFIKDHFDWHVMFVGQYAVGDISYVGLKSVNNANGFYWKETKNFADDISYHVKDSVFINDPNDQVFRTLQTYLPGRQCAFRMKNVTYVGSYQPYRTGAIAAPQHCGIDRETDATCMIHYLFEDVRFLNSGTSVSFGASRGSPLAPAYISFDGSLKNDDKVAISPLLNGFSKLDGCSGADQKYGLGYGCDVNTKVRRLMMWSMDQGDLKITGPGYVDVEPSDKTDGANAGKLKYYRQDGHIHLNNLKYGGGYGAWVVAGEAYIISGIQWMGDTPHFSFSDVHVPKTEGIAPENEYVSLILKMTDPTDGSNQLERECRINAGHSRKWLGSNGVAHGYECDDCCQAIFDMAKEIGITTTKTTTTTTMTPEPYDCPFKNSAWDLRCDPNVHDPFHGLGCAFGRTHCRICKSDDETSHWINCSEIPTQTTTTTTATTTTTKTTTTTTTATRLTTPLSTTMTANYCKGCGTYDARCWTSDDPHGGLGCNACGKPKCRYCKSDDSTSHLINCSSIGTQATTTTTTATTSTTTSSTTTKTNYCKGCGTYDARCWTSEDPHGGLGCNACGKPKCRYCKSDDSTAPWIRCSDIQP